MKWMLFVFFMVWHFQSHAQSDSSVFNAMFYNVENLFDCKDDSLTNDDEFLPEGDKKWTSYKLYQKINGLGKVILAANGWQLPDIIGLCEIENAEVLKLLLYHNGLDKLGYRYIHFDGPDARGVDVALLYRQKSFEVVHAESLNVSDADMGLQTRDVLYVKGLLATGDTLNVFVNHWPSKRGGALHSESRRSFVARQILAHIQAIQEENSNSSIIVMGDFNAEFDTESLLLLQSQESENSLYPTIDGSAISTKAVAGSHKYQGQWSIIDHMFVSAALYKKLQSKNVSCRIVDLPFLLEDDFTYSGLKPKRTYNGPSYMGGISDHLPIILEITFTKTGGK